MKHLKEYIVIILTFFGCVFLYEYTHKSDQKSDFSDLRNYNKIKEIHDTVYQQKTFTKYKIGDSIPYVIIATDTIQVHDTAYILGDYYAIKAYSDTIKADSNTFVIQDTISQNSIKSRSFTAQIKERTVLIKEFYAEKAKNTLYLGFRGDFSPSNGLEVLSPGLMLNAKNKALIGLNIDLGLNREIRYSTGVYFKLGKK